LEQSLLFQRLGSVSAADGQQIKAAWAMRVKPQF